MNTDCWLSPEGKIYYGLCHQDIAEDIVEKVYGLTADTIKTEEGDFMGSITQPCLDLPIYFIHPCFSKKRCGFSIALTPTQAQINAAFAETGDNIAKGA